MPAGKKILLPSPPQIGVDCAAGVSAGEESAHAPPSRRGTSCHTFRCPGVWPSREKVEVTNFPDPQNVTGSVTVTNYPLTVQLGIDPVEVSGQVAATNLPSCGQPMRGSFPTLQIDLTESLCLNAIA